MCCCCPHGSQQPQHCPETQIDRSRTQWVLTVLCPYENGLPLHPLICWMRNCPFLQGILKKFVSLTEQEMLATSEQDFLNDFFK